MNISECFKYILLLVWPEISIKHFLDSFSNPLYVIYKVLKIKQILYSPDSDECELTAFTKFTFPIPANIF